MPTRLAHGDWEEAFCAWAARQVQLWLAAMLSAVERSQHTRHNKIVAESNAIEAKAVNSARTVW